MSIDSQPQTTREVTPKEKKSHTDSRSTSKDSASKYHALCISQARLDLYGPLEVKNVKDFLEKAKARFFENYYTQPATLKSMDQFDFLTTISSGSFGSVRLVHDKNDKTYFAAKVLEKKRLVELDQVVHTASEKRVLQSIDFPFAVRMVYLCASNSYIYFVMPYISGGDMFTHLQRFGRFDEELSRFYAAQVVLALEYLQLIKYVYRDLKPENILVDHLGYLKLTDFGFAKLVEGRTYTFCGTPAYIAPEIIMGTGYSRSVDWWSLGVLLYEMASGYTPFFSSDIVKLYIKTMYKQLIMPMYFSASLQSLVRSLLQRDVTRRIGNLKGGAQDVKRHAWFKKTDWLQVLSRKALPPFIPKTQGDSDVSNYPKNRQCSVLEESDTEEYADAFKEF